MKKLKIAAVRSPGGKYHAIEIHGEGPNPSSETPPMIGQTITLALLRGSGMKERGQAWAKTVKALRKVLVEAENQAADLGGLGPLKMYVLMIDADPESSWWVAARSMGEALDVADLKLPDPHGAVRCREATVAERPVHTWPSNVAGQDPWDLLHCVAEYRSRVLGCVEAT